MKITFRGALSLVCAISLLLTCLPVTVLSDEMVTASDLAPNLCDEYSSLVDESEYASFANEETVAPVAEEPAQLSSPALKASAEQSDEFTVQHNQDQESAETEQQIIDANSENIAENADAVTDPANDGTAGDTPEASVENVPAASVEEAARENGVTVTDEIWADCVIVVPENAEEADLTASGDLEEGREFVIRVTSVAETHLYFRLTSEAELQAVFATENDEVCLDFILDATDNPEGMEENEAAEKCYSLTAHFEQGSTGLIRILSATPNAFSLQVLTTAQQQNVADDQAGEKTEEILVVSRNETPVETPKAETEPEGEAALEGQIPEEVPTFEIKDNILVHYNGEDEDVVVPEGIREIGPQAFQGNETVKTVTLPDSVELINNAAFADCVNLEKIIRSEQSLLATIGNGAFRNDVKLDISFAENVPNVLINAFEGAGVAEKAEETEETEEGIETQEDGETEETEETEEAEEDEEFWEEVISEHIDDYTVTVTVTKEAEFPIGTTIRITPLDSDEYRSEAENVFDKNDTELGTFIRAFDITFCFDGMEIEPLAPVDVKITFDNAVQLEGDNELKLIHLHEEEEAREIEAETLTGETTEIVDEETEETINIITNVESMSFQSGQFSTYIVAEEVVVYSFTESGNNYEVVLKYNSWSNVPEDAVFSVEEITKDSELYEQYVAQVAAVINPTGTVRMPALLDISLKTADGQKVQLDNKVQVIVRLTGDESLKKNLNVVHFPDEDPFLGESAVRDAVAAVAESEENAEIEVLDIESEQLYARVNTKENSVSFSTDSFSVFALAYTVDFYYGEFEYHLDGGGVMTLSELFALLKIDHQVEDVKSVTFSNPELLQVKKIEEDTTLGELIVNLGLEEQVELTEEDTGRPLNAGDWALISLQAFNTTEALTIDFANGDQIVVRVEDARGYVFQFNVNDTNAGLVYQNSSSYNSSLNLQVNDSGTVNAVMPRSANDPTNGHLQATRGYHFVKWVLHGINDYGMGDTNPSQYNYLYNIQPVVGVNSVEDHAQTFTACFVPNNQYLILYTWDPTNGDVTAGNARHFEYIYPQAPYTETAWQYFSYSNDESGMIATPHDGYFFKGWYNLANNELVCTDFTFNGSQVTSDMIVYPCFERTYWYRARVNDASMGYLTQTGVNAFNSAQQNASVYTGSETDFYHVSIVAKAGGFCSIYNNTYPNARLNYEFRFWVKDDGTYPNVLHRDNDCLRGSGGGDDKNLIDRDGTTYVAFFAPAGEKIVRLNYAQPSGSGNTAMTDGSNLGFPRTLDANGDGTDDFYYLYTNDQSGIQVSQTSEQAEKYTFKGWYNEDGRLISSETSLQINKGSLPADINDFVLTPVFEEKPKERNYFIVCYDGSNGLNGGDPANNTFYSRLESTGRIQGSTTFSAEVTKIADGSSFYADITLPTADQIVSPQSVGANHFALQGWYNIKTKEYRRPGESVRITDDSVFYADWFPDNYNFAASAGSVSSVNTNSFITTNLYDFNNLFNMDSIELEPDRTYIQTDENETDVSKKHKNYEYWKMKANPERDFLFISTVSGFGRSLNPAGRTAANQDHEVSDSDAEFAGTVTTGLYNRSPFAQSSSLGMRSLGSANYLYQYDSATGYYYYDSDKNAASFNQSAGRFYVYDYRNGTNKSNGGYDFLPLNYGNTTFNEAWGAPNYWFGMTSSINFFLPNATGFQDANNEYGNRSTVGDEMVYKFSGDDDVWVFVDGSLVLDMGGIHGKVYGEINFSRGTWKIAQSGASKTVDSRGIMTYGSGGNVISGTINLTEGDHTLTLYYLERGASQSNCAIYFNLAPRYTLQFRKVDSESDAGLTGATFGIYTNPECTVAADVWGTYSGTHTNAFSVGPDGIAHCTGLVAGRTYYIKELTPPNDYPDISQEVITLTISANGTPSVSSTLDESGSGWQMASVTSSELDSDTANNGTFTLYLKVKNKKKTVTEITAQKTWSLADGKEFKTLNNNSIIQDTSSWVKVRLDRYYIDESGGTNMDNHTVQFVTQYYTDSSGKPSNRDDQTVTVYQIETRSVPDNGTILFSLSTDSGAAIRSVTAASGILNYNPHTPTEGRLFYAGGGWTDLYTKADNVSVSNIQNDLVIYITFIGSAASEVEFAAKTHLTGIGDGTSTSAPRKIVKETQFTLEDSQSREVTLNQGNSWKHTWTNLLSSDGSKKYYYYVTEIDSSVTTREGCTLGPSSFVKTYSSDGLSTGTIVVHNTMQAIRVKLRKKDAAKDPANNKDIPIQGAKFKLYTEEEYTKLKNNQTATAITPENAMILPIEMGTPVGTELQTDALGRFYTGYLPIGTYYIVEVTPADGYDPLEHDVKVVISPNGLAYDLQGGSGTMVSRRPGSDGVYNLYIPNRIKKGSIQIEKQWLTANANAEYVLVSLGRISNDAIDNISSLMSDIAAHPENYGLTSANIDDTHGGTYLKIPKTSNAWPVLTVTNLPVKRSVALLNPQNQNEVTGGAYYDCYYYITEIGYGDATTFHTLPTTTGSIWQASYSGTGSSCQNKTVSGQEYVCIQPQTGTPDKLTVTNRLVYTFVKKDNANHPLAGAVFSLTPVEGGQTPLQQTFTSDANGVVTISGVPAGDYLVNETSAPLGYVAMTTPYYLHFGYDNCTLYSDSGKTTVVGVITNQPLTVSVRIIKESAETTPQPLSGAVFALYADNNNQPAATPMTGYDHLVSGSDGVVKKGTDTKLVLGEGTYWLRETTVPAGYQLPEGPIKIVVSDSRRNTTDHRVVTMTLTSQAEMVIEDTNNSGIYVLHIPNTPGVELPATGGHGTTVYTILGLLMISLAGAILLVRKRKHSA